MSLIHLTDAVAHYGPKPALDRVSIEIKQGELVAVMGPNGMGKSTLLKLIAGVIPPLAGEVKVNGLLRRSSRENEIAIRKQMAFLPDHPWIPKMHTGRQFLWETGKIYGVDPIRLAEHIHRLLDLFELDHCGDGQIYSYSNGQKKKIAIASVLATEAPILILDEPFTGGLDPSGIFALKQVLKELAAHQERTVLIASQVPELVEELAHRVAVLDHGRLAAFSTMDEIRTQGEGQAHILAHYLEKLIAPETDQRVADYFGMAAAE